MCTTEGILGQLIYIPFWTFIGLIVAAVVPWCILCILYFRRPPASLTVEQPPASDLEKCVRSVLTDGKAYSRSELEEVLGINSWDNEGRTTLLILLGRLHSEGIIKTKQSRYRLVSGR